MFTPTPDFLCDFKFEPGFDIPAKLRAFHKNGYSQREEDDKLHKIRRSMAFGDLDKISTIIDDIGMKNLPDIHDYDEIQEIDLKQKKHFETLQAVQVGKRQQFEQELNLSVYHPRS